MSEARLTGMHFMRGAKLKAIARYDHVFNQSQMFSYYFFYQNNVLRSLKASHKEKKRKKKKKKTIKKKNKKKKPPKTKTKRQHAFVQK